MLRQDEPMSDNAPPETIVEWTQEDDTSLCNVFDFENMQARTHFLQARTESDKQSYSTKPPTKTIVEADATVTTRASVAEQEITFSVQPMAMSALEYLSDVASQQPRVSSRTEYSASGDTETSSKTAFVSVWARYNSTDTTPLSTPAAKQALSEWKLHCAYDRWLSEREENNNDPMRGTQLYDSLEAKRIVLYKGVRDRYMTR